MSEFPRGRGQSLSTWSLATPERVGWASGTGPIGRFPVGSSGLVRTGEAMKEEAARASEGQGQ